MVGRGAEARGLDLAAVVAGWVVGAALMVVGSAALSLVVWRVAVGPGALAVAAAAIQGLAALAAGLRSGHRAVGNGLVHGILAGLALAATAAVADSVTAGLPGLVDVARKGGLLAGAGALGGILGVNRRW